MRLNFNVRGSPIDTNGAVGKQHVLSLFGVFL